MRRRGVVFAAAAAALAIAATYLTVTLTYRLEHGGLSAAGDLHPLVADTQVRIPVSVRNPGRLPIVLDDVSFEHPIFVVAEVTVSRGPEDCCTPQHATPFHSVDVGPHDEVTIWLLLRVKGGIELGSCNVVQLHDASVHYHVLGIPRSGQIPLPTTVSFAVPCT